MLTVGGSGVSDPAALAAVSADAELVFSAVPAAGHYVESWTGACAGSETGEDLAAEATTTCTVAAGNANVNAGATFADVAECAGANVVRETATSCGCGTNFADPNPDDGSLECAAVVTCGTNQESH